MYGERDDPYAVLSRLGQRLEATIAPEAALSTIAETIAQALKVPYVAIALCEVPRNGLEPDDGLCCSQSGRAKCTLSGTGNIHRDVHGLPPNRRSWDHR